MEDWQLLNTLSSLNIEITIINKRAIQYEKRNALQSKYIFVVLCHLR